MERRGYSVHEVGQMYGVQPSRVRRWIRRRDLGATRVGRVYLVTVRDLEAFEAKGRDG